MDPYGFSLVDKLLESYGGLRSLSKHFVSTLHVIEKEKGVDTHKYYKTISGKDGNDVELITSQGENFWHYVAPDMDRDLKDILRNFAFSSYRTFCYISPDDKIAGIALGYTHEVLEKFREIRLKKTWNSTHISTRQFIQTNGKGYVPHPVLFFYSDETDEKQFQKDYALVREAVKSSGELFSFVGCMGQDFKPKGIDRNNIFSFSDEAKKHIIELLFPDNNELGFGSPLCVDVEELLTLSRLDPLKKGTDDCHYGFILYFPTASDSHIKSGLQIAFTSDIFVSNSGIGEVANRVSQFLRGIARVCRAYGLAIERHVFVATVMEASTRSAIGSIMSRNGSHNIGSHVLSALSHNVGTMPDDRVLYQYIQHRMDYIATATTEFPQWTTPTMFVAGVMKNFYSQKHLLDYISRSEGLRAYKFQERNLDDAARMNQHGTIRIFLRRFFDLTKLDKGTTNLPDHRQLVYDFKTEGPWSVYHFFGERAKMFRRVFSTDKHIQYEVSEAGGTAKFLEYDERFTPDWKQDVRVAIPGGIVGQHAFYTIIENVIRNAAKHGWAAEQNRKEKDLEIFVDFYERENAGEVVFTIGDNVSNVFEKKFWEDFFKWSDRRSFPNGKDGDVEFLKRWVYIFDVFSEEIKLVSETSTFDSGQVIKKAYYVLDAWIQETEKLANGKVSALEEVLREKAIEQLDGLIPRAFAAPLTAKDAGLLEKYLQRESGEGGELPLIYRIQRLFWDYSPIQLNYAIFWAGYIGKSRPISELFEKRKENVQLVLPLHHDQHRKLAQSFIKSDGTLRPENWGLAEMKISAGFLGHRSVSEIGGLSVDGNNILVPIAMPGVCRNADNLHNCIACSFKDKREVCHSSDPECPLRNHRFHLGYRFAIATPKDILLVFKNESSLQSIGGLPNKLRGKGIHCAYVKTENDETQYYLITDKGVEEVKDFNYRFVVTEENYECKRFVFRQLDFDAVSVEKGKNLLKYLVEVNAKVKDFGDDQMLAIRKAVLSAWVKKLGKNVLPGQDLPVKLVLNVTGNENGRERGLVTTKDLLQTMFLECYHTALISFIKTPPESLGLSDTTRHLITLLSLIKVMPDKMVASQQDYGHGADYGAKEYIRKQLVAYCDLLKSHLLLSVQFIDALKSIDRYVKDEEGAGDAEISREIESIGKDFEKAIARRLFRAKLDEDEVVRRECEQLISFLRKVDKKHLDNLLDAFHGVTSHYSKEQDSENKDSGFYTGGRHSFEDNLRAVIKACAVPEEYEFEALVESLNSMFLASDVYLRKYEERIATLPEAYKHDGSDQVRKGKTSKEITLQKMVDDLLGSHMEGSSGSDHDAECRIIKYSRHDRAKPENAIYSEALSGSQSYLNALSRLSSGIANNTDDHYVRYAGITRLLENAFLRILIIDERVMNFVNDRTSDEMIKTFVNMGIWVADVQNPRPAQDRSTVTDSLYGLEHFDLKPGNQDFTEDKLLDMGDASNQQFDILIIHQGIIDKWWGRAKHDPNSVKTILDNIRKKCCIPWVVVTTGRGRPENIPEDEKVLPFSVIESSLFRRYPEKLILVNTVMNLLPYGKKDKTT